MALVDKTTRSTRASRCSIKTTKKAHLPFEIQLQMAVFKEQLRGSFGKETRDPTLEKSNRAPRCLLTTGLEPWLIFEKKQLCV